MKKRDVIGIFLLLLFIFGGYFWVENKNNSSYSDTGSYSSDDNNSDTKYGIKKLDIDFPNYSYDTYDADGYIKSDSKGNIKVTGRTLANSEVDLYYTTVKSDKNGYFTAKFNLNDPKHIDKIEGKQKVEEYDVNTLDHTNEEKYVVSVDFINESMKGKVDLSDDSTDPSENIDNSDVDTTESDDDEFDPNTLKDLVKKQLDSDGIGDPVIKNVKINGQFMNKPYTASVELDALDPGDASENYVFVNSALAATQKLKDLDSFESIKYVVSTEFENSVTGKNFGYMPVTIYVFDKDFIKNVDPQMADSEDLKDNATDYSTKNLS